MTTPNEVKFILDRPQSDKPTYILLLYRFNNERLKYSTGRKIMPADWSPELQRARTDHATRKDRQPFVELNTVLGRYESAVGEWANRMLLAREPMTTQLLKQHLNERFQAAASVKTVRTTFPVFMETFISDIETGKRLTRQSRRYSHNTVKDYKKDFRILQHYQAAQGKGKLDFNSFTLTFYSQFKNYMTANGYAINTIGSIIKNLKIWLNIAYRDGLHDTTIFKHEDFKKMAEDVDNIYLNDRELQTLYELSLTTNAKLDRVRDLFLIGCYTGLRFSDYTDLSVQNVIHQGRVLDVVTKKTGNRVQVPLNPNVVAILTKYDYRLPRAISNQKFNCYLKELGQQCSLTDKVQVSRTEGGRKITRTLEKWELITTHTARRSFATNAYRAKVPTIDIMKLTGHKTETSFMKYIKITAEDVALRLLDHPHFLGQSDSKPDVIFKIA